MGEMLGGKDKTTRIKNAILYAALFLFSLQILIAIGKGDLPENEKYPGPESPPQRFVLDASVCLSLRWEVRNVISAKSLAISPMVAQNGSLFVFAGLDPGGEMKLRAIEGSLGVERWSAEGVQALAADKKRIYQGHPTESLSARTFDGEVIWTKRLWFARSVVSIIPLGESLYVNTGGGGVYLIDSGTGEILGRSQSGEIIGFPSPVIEALRYDPVVVDNLLYYRPGNRLELVKAVVAMKANGEIFWISDPNTISNPAVSRPHVFVLTDTGELQILDISTGQIIESLRLEPPLDFRNPETDDDSAGYEIAVDSENNLLYVLLGNSDQLFAFEILCE